MDSSPITGQQSKWARNSLSFSQSQVVAHATKAGKKISLSRLKAFEAGYYRPSEEFARELLELYESKGVDFRESVRPLQNAESSRATSPAPQAGLRPCFYFCPELDDAEAQRWFDAIEVNQVRMHELYEKGLALNGAGELKEESLGVVHELLNCLALDSLMIRTLIGWDPVRPRPLDRKKASKLRDAVADFFYRNTEAQRPADSADELSDDEADAEGETA